MPSDFSKILENRLNEYFTETCGDKIPSNLYDHIIHEVEQVLINKTLDYVNGNQTKAAKILGLSRNTLSGKLKTR
ncbi:MAG: hypothetical protein LBI30_02055 [Holosporales bacterium]|nr:hypothetical protein [Holosporales bacterium]